MPHLRELVVVVIIGIEGHRCRASGDTEVAEVVIVTAVVAKANSSMQTISQMRVWLVGHSITGREEGSTQQCSEVRTHRRQRRLKQLHQRPVQRRKSRRRPLRHPKRP